MQAPLPKTVFVSTFQCAADNRPNLWEGPWDEWAQEVVSHGHVISAEDSEAAKVAYPMFAPARFKSRRSANDALGVSMLVLDYDHVSMDTILGAMVRAQDNGWAFLVYTSWKHTPAEPRMRLVAPLSRPAGREEWPALWARLNALLGGGADTQCRDISRAYFLPAVPETRRFHAQVSAWPGGAIDVDAVLRLPLPAEVIVLAQGHGTQRISAADLRGLLPKLKRSDPALAIALGCVLAGEPFAEAGTRDTTLFKLAGELAKAFPEAAPAHLAVHFDRSISQWPDFDLSDVEDKIARRLTELATIKATAEAASLDAARARILEATQGARSTPYTQAEIDETGEAGLADRWILQKGKSFWFYVLGKGYVGPFIDAEATRAAHTYLAPTTGVGVRLTEITDLGRNRFRTISELVLDYGQVAVHVVHDMHAQKHSWDAATSTLTLAPCPRRSIDPVFHPQVDLWLRELGGELYPFLELWIAYLVHTDKACVGLFLEGEPGCGKSMLAKGLSRLWSTLGPAPMTEAVGSFNSGLTRCPLVFADETMPRELRGRTAELRELIQGTARPYREKYQPSATVAGALRILIAANNRNVLEGEEHLTQADVSAIAGRLLHIEVPHDAAWWKAFFTNVSTTGWVDQDLIAAHAVYLAAQHPLPEKHPRFLIDPPTAELAKTITTSTMSGSAVAHWLVAFILNPGKLFTGRASNDSAWLMQIEAGALYASSRTICEHWGTYPTNVATDKASVRTVGTGLAALSSKQVRRMNGNEFVRLFEVRVDNLIAWAERNGMATAEQIRAALAKDTKAPKAAVTGAN